MEDSKNARFSCPSCELVFTERALEYHRNTCKESDDCICDSCVICKRDSNKPMPKRRKISRTTDESPSEENPEQKNVQQENTSTEIKNYETLASNIDGETHSPNVDMQYANNRINTSASQSNYVIHNNFTCTRKLFCNTCSQHIPFDCYGLHVIQHSARSEDSKFICPECTESYKKPHRLIMHILKHYQHLSCENCHCYYSGCTLNGIQTIDEHCHSLSVKCYICSCVSNSPKSFDKHMEGHLVKMPFICKKCKRGFSNKGDLQCHSEVHRIMYSNRCHFCEKTFSKQATLQSHIRTHFEFNLHQCTMCDKSFTKRGNLKRHMARHYSAKKFSNSLILASSNNDNSENEANFRVNEVCIQDFNSDFNERSLQESTHFNDISNIELIRKFKIKNNYSLL